MRTLTMNEVQDVNGAGLTAAEGAGLVLTLAVCAPVGLAMGFGLAVAAGLVWATTY